MQFTKVDLNDNNRIGFNYETDPIYLNRFVSIRI